MNRQYLSFLSLVMLLLLAACGGGQRQEGAKAPQENARAKAMLQGVWLDDETLEPVFSVHGDTIFYSDSTSMPSLFSIVGDSLVLSSGSSYAVVRQTENHFSFRNHNGDEIRLRKSDDPEDAQEFTHEIPAVMTYTHQVKTDSTVIYGGDRYHWYIAINPTKYKVVNHTFNDDGIEVDNVYYDNIMHISVYKGAQRLYSSDFRKQQYASLVPAKFLEEAVLCNMEYSSAGPDGLHFTATLCIPDGASCYLVETIVSYAGQMSMRLKEY